jgi:hypothetical protein
MDIQFSFPAQLVISWWHVVAFFGVVLVLWVLDVVVALWRGNRQHRAGPVVHKLMEMEAELLALREEVRFLKQRLSLGELEDAAPVEDTPYNQAIHLAVHGATAQAIADQCNISRGEAELIVALYRSLPHERR